LASRFEDALIVVAHHREDQVETFFLHLLRNSGLAGLSGMDERQGNILRPLLCYSKAEIESYATTNGIVWRLDKSNLETTYLRNTLRLEIIPFFNSRKYTVNNGYTVVAKRIKSSLSRGCFTSKRLS